MLIAVLSAMHVRGSHLFGVVCELIGLSIGVGDSEK